MVQKSPSVVFYLTYSLVKNQLIVRDFEAHVYYEQFHFYDDADHRLTQYHHYHYVSQQDGAICDYYDPDHVLLRNDQRPTEVLQRENDDDSVF